MVRTAEPPKMLKPMLRSVAFVALACALWAPAAHAQLSESDLLMRIDHLEAELRDLTGMVEQLQYRNQQLEQQVQRLQANAPQAAAQPSAQASHVPNIQVEAPPGWDPTLWADFRKRCQQIGDKMAARVPITRQELSAVEACAQESRRGQTEPKPPAPPSA